MNSFNKKLLLIYTTKFFGILTGFLSILLVVPRLTSNPTIYGVYTICTSLGLFFSYADFGFLAACQKYAAEYYFKKELKQEMKIIAFALFILATFISLIIFFLVFVAFNPSLIIKTTNLYDLKVASQLIFILIAFAPVIIIQKLNVLVFSIRIEDYIYQSIDVVFNIIKIGIISLFVTSANYEIVGYYVSIQTLTLLSTLIAVAIIKYRYHYQFFFFLKQFRFSKEVYIKTKDLAFSSLLLTIAWILYFEMDTIILSKFYGVQTVAIYAVAVVFLNFLRTFYNTLYSPYSAYFYRFTVDDDIHGLNNAFSSLIKWSFPLIVIPSLVLILNMKTIIQLWVGPSYQKSILISQMFVFTIALTAICIPISFYFIANAFNKTLRFLALLLPFVFYSSLFLYDYFGFKEVSLASSTLTTIIVNTFFFIGIMAKKTTLKIMPLLFSVMIKCTMPVVIALILYLLIPRMHLNPTNTSYSYIQFCSTFLCTVAIPLFVYYFIEESTRKKIAIFLKS
jgi:O-antigen/teichoic acid export membrane protein